MRVVIAGQKRFGRDVLELMLARNWEVLDVFCPDLADDKLRIAATNHRLPTSRRTATPTSRRKRDRRRNSGRWAITLRFCPGTAGDRRSNGRCALARQRRAGRCFGSTTPWTAGRWPRRTFATFSRAIRRGICGRGNSRRWDCGCFPKFSMNSTAGSCAPLRRIPRSRRGSPRWTVCRRCGVPTCLGSARAGFVSSPTTSQRHDDVFRASFHEFPPGRFEDHFAELTLSLECVPER